MSHMADCPWIRSRNPPRSAKSRGLGRQICPRLRPHGIAYQSGATVILQGPCIYEVDSPCGGFLSLGKLTAQSREVRGQRSEVRGQKSESEISNPCFASPLSPLPCFPSALRPRPSSPTWAPRVRPWKSKKTGATRRSYVLPGEGSSCASRARPEKATPAPSRSR